MRQPTFHPSLPSNKYCNAVWPRNRDAAGLPAARISRTMSRVHMSKASLQQQWACRVDVLQGFIAAGIWPQWQPQIMVGAQRSTSQPTAP